jgi:hypothetical protein
MLGRRCWWWSLISMSRTGESRGCLHSPHHPACPNLPHTNNPSPHHPINLHYRPPKSTSSTSTHSSTSCIRHLTDLLPSSPSPSQSSVPVDQILDFIDAQMLRRHGCSRFRFTSSTRALLRASTRVFTRQSSVTSWRDGEPGGRSSRITVA